MIHIIIIVIIMIIVIIKVIPLLDTKSIVRMLDNLTLWKHPHLPSKAHSDVDVFTQPGDFIQCWILGLYPKLNVLDCHFIHPSCDHSSLYQVILCMRPAAKRPASETWRMIFVDSCR